MEQTDTPINGNPDPKEKLSHSLAEEVHFMRSILSSLSEEISLLKTNVDLDEKPFLNQRGEFFSKLHEIRKTRAAELPPLHLEKNWDMMVIASCELKVLEGQIVSLFQKIQDETKILANMRNYPKQAWTMQPSDAPKSKIQLTTEPKSY